MLGQRTFVFPAFPDYTSARRPIAHRVRIDPRWVPLLGFAQEEVTLS